MRTTTFDHVLKKDVYIDPSGEVLVPVIFEGKHYVNKMRFRVVNPGEKAYFELNVFYSPDIGQKYTFLFLPPDFLMILSTRHPPSFHTIERNESKEFALEINPDEVQNTRITVTVKNLNTGAMRTATYKCITAEAIPNSAKFQKRFTFLSGREAGAKSAIDHVCRVKMPYKKYLLFGSEWNSTLNVFFRSVEIRLGQSVAGLEVQPILEKSVFLGCCNGGFF